eukprot:1194876-Prorocentrum_minimum.AAC.2
MALSSPKHHQHARKLLPTGGKCPVPVSESFAPVDVDVDDVDVDVDVDRGATLLPQVFPGLHEEPPVTRHCATLRGLQAAVQQPRPPAHDAGPQPLLPAFGSPRLTSLPSWSSVQFRWHHASATTVG